MEIQDYKWCLKYECLGCGRKWRRYTDEKVDYAGDYCQVCERYSPNSFVEAIDQHPEIEEANQ